MSNIEEIENYNTFTQRVIKQIVSKDDEETRKLLIKYAKEKYPKDKVRIDFYDEEIVKKVISLGITEYIKTQNDLYKTRVLGEFNTTTNNIEEDIKIVEKNIDINSLMFGNGNAELSEKIRNSIENILNELKRVRSIDIYKLVEDVETEQLMDKEKVKEKIDNIFTVFYERYECDYQDIQDVISEIHKTLRERL